MMVMGEVYKPLQYLRLWYYRYTPFEYNCRPFKSMKKNRFHVPNGVPVASMRLSVFDSLSKNDVCMYFSEAVGSQSDDKEGLEVTRKIKRFLEHAGWDVWYSKESIAGVKWDVQWKQRAASALACILCLTRAWVESPACQTEFDFLVENDIHTINSRRWRKLQTGWGLGCEKNQIQPNIWQLGNTAVLRKYGRRDNLRKYRESTEMS